MAPTLGVNIAVFDARGWILLTRRDDFEVWCLPSGGVDPGESLAEAARRETREESGLEVVLTGVVGVYSRPGSDYFVGHVVLFAARPVGGSLHTQAGETIEVAWFDPRHLPEDLLVLQRLRIQHALEGWGGSAAWTFPLDWSSLSVGDRDGIYRLRDASGLSRAEFHRRYLSRTLAPGPVCEVGAEATGQRPGPGATNLFALSPETEIEKTYTYGTEVAVIQDGRLLLTRREDFDVWCLPGGHCENGEALAQAARREVLEETGLQVELTHLVGVYSELIGGVGRVIHIYLFAARPVGGSLEGQGSEVQECRFFAPGNLPVAQDFFFGNHQMAQDALRGVGGGVVWTQRIPWPYPGLERQEIYALRDASGLGRAEFYRRTNPLPQAGDEVNELVSTAKR